jgi:hypothetical protein
MASSQARRRDRREQSEPWQPLERAVDRHGRHVVPLGDETFALFRNHRYTVARRYAGPGLVHLSIKRNDRRPIFDWRDMQQIKNEMIGPECEGLQLFPAESRLLDTANQYHIYGWEDPQVRAPFGYDERIVAEESTDGAVQRPFPAERTPADLLTPDRLAAAVAACQEGRGDV